MTDLSSLTADQLMEKGTWGNTTERLNVLDEFARRLKAAEDALDAAEQQAAEWEAKWDSAIAVTARKIDERESAETRATKATNALKELLDGLTVEFDYGPGQYLSLQARHDTLAAARAVLADLAAEEEP